MTAIEGLVIKSSGSYLKIRLKSGKVLNTPKVKQLAFGDKAWICFNYTNMSVKDILTDYEYHELEKDVEIETSPVVNQETGVIEGIVIGDSVFLSD